MIRSSSIFAPLVFSPALCCAGTTRNDFSIAQHIFHDKERKASFDPFSSLSYRFPSIPECFITKWVINDRKGGRWPGVFRKRFPKGTFSWAIGSEAPDLTWQITSRAYLPGSGRFLFNKGSKALSGLFLHNCSLGFGKGRPGAGVLLQKNVYAKASSGRMPFRRSTGPYLPFPHNLCPQMAGSGRSFSFRINPLFSKVAVTANRLFTDKASAPCFHHIFTHAVSAGCLGNAAPTSIQGYKVVSIGSVPLFLFIHTKLHKIFDMDRTSTRSFVLLYPRTG